MNNTETRCTCSLQVSSMNEACESCQREYALWREEQERAAWQETRLTSQLAIVEAAAELFGAGTPEEFSAPVLFAKMRRLNAALWSAA